MTNLTNQSEASTYGDLLTTTNNGQGLSNVLHQVQDGFGNASTITIATNAVNFNRQGGNTFQLDGVSITSLGVDINSLCQPNPVCLGNSSFRVPVGTTAQRPGFPQRGDFRLNSDTNNLEYYTGAVWRVVQAI